MVIWWHFMASLKKREPLRTPTSRSRVKGNGKSKAANKHLGSGIDDFLKQEGIFEEAQAVKEVIAWQLGEAMKERKISKSQMAGLLQTSRSQVDRLLDPANDVTLSSLQRAAGIVGRRLTIELT